MARAERLGVEQVPPLQHDKHGEEHRELAYGDLAPAVEPYQHAEQGGEEQYAHRADGPRHVGVDDEVGLLAGLLVHHLVRPSMTKRMAMRVSLLAPQNASTTYRRLLDSSF